MSKKQGKNLQKNHQKTPGSPGPANVSDEVLRPDPVAGIIKKLQTGKELTPTEVATVRKVTRTNGNVTVAAKAAEIADAEIIKTQDEAAKFARVTKRTIRRWQNSGLPRTKEGYYIKSFLTFFADNEGRLANEDRDRQVKAEADLKEIKAKLAQIELDIKRGDLIPRTDIVTQQIAKIQAAKRAFLFLPRKLAPQLARVRDPRKIQKRLTDEIREIINAFAGDQAAPGKPTNDNSG